LLNEIYVAIPFLLLFAFGFGYVSLLSLWQAGRQRVRGAINTNTPAQRRAEMTPKITWEIE
jgi:hypothetical protein